MATCPSATVPNGCVPLSCRFRCPCRAQTSELSCAPARLRAFPRPGCGRCTAAALGRPSRHQVDVLPLSCCCPPSFFRYPSSPPETAGERRESRGTRRCMPKKATFFFKGRGKITVPYFKLFFIFVLLSPLDPKKKQIFLHGPCRSRRKMDLLVTWGNEGILFCTISPNFYESYRTRKHTEPVLELVEAAVRITHDKAQNHTESRHAPSYPWDCEPFSFQKRPYCTQGLEFNWRHFSSNTNMILW